MKSEHLGRVGFSFAVEDDADNVFVRLEISRLGGGNGCRLEQRDETLAWGPVIFLPILPLLPLQLSDPTKLKSSNLFGDPA